jgi:hypothetical protein
MTPTNPDAHAHPGHRLLMLVMDFTFSFVR